MGGGGRSQAEQGKTPPISGGEDQKSEIGRHEAQAQPRGQTSHTQNKNTAPMNKYRKKQMAKENKRASTTTPMTRITK